MILMKFLVAAVAITLVCVVIAICFLLVRSMYKISRTDQEAVEESKRRVRELEKKYYGE